MTTNATDVADAAMPVQLKQNKHSAYKNSKNERQLKDLQK